MTEADVKRIPLTRIQKLIGRRMLESKQNQPCFYMMAKADIGGIAESRRQISKQLGTRVMMNDFFIRAMAIAVERFPLMAGVFKDSHIEIAENINVGFAFTAPKGLVVPVVKNANSRSLADIAKETAELTGKARTDKLSLEDLSGACITLTALGMFGIDSFLAIPIPGQCGIISVGKIIEEPFAYDGEIASRKVIELGLAADGRIVGADYAARFLVEITNLVANPKEIVAMPATAKH